MGTVAPHPPSDRAQYTVDRLVIGVYPKGTNSDNSFLTTNDESAIGITQVL